MAAKETESDMGSDMSSSRKIFSKRPGTTDKGKSYEQLYVAYLLLKLAMDETVENFHLSSNDINYGAFDDVVVEIKYIDKKELETLAIQLKHVNKSNKTVTLETLQKATSGNFDISKYLKDYNSNATMKNYNGVLKLILLTNTSLNVMETLQLNIDNGAVEMTQNNDDVLNKLLNTETEQKKTKRSSYIFQSTNNCDFFNKLRLYANQANVDDLEKAILKLFKDNFHADESAFNEFKNIIIRWSMVEKDKIMLDKTLTKSLIALTVLSPHMKTLSLSDHGLITGNQQTFTDAVLKFKITVLNDVRNDKIKNMWKKPNEEDYDEKEFKDLSKYVTPSDTENLNDKQKNKIFWLMGKCPLVVKEYTEFHEIVNFVGNRNIVILCSSKSDNLKNMYVPGGVLFDLSDLKTKGSVYDRILDTFTYSLEGQAETILRNLLNVDSNITNMITTDKLVAMIDGPLQIGKEVETLPTCHISRSLSKIMVGLDFLLNTKDNLILIHDIKDKTAFKKKLKKASVSDKDTEIHITDRPDSNLVRILDSEIDYEQFNIYANDSIKKNCHQFKYWEKDHCLEWIRSKEHASELVDFRTDHKYDYSTHESALLSNIENDINVVCANAGMGKSTLAKSLKNTSCSSTWTLIVYARHHTSSYSQMGGSIMKFIQGRINGTYTKDSFEEKFLQKFVNQRKVRIIWDGLDEVTEGDLDIILDGILVIASKNGFKQWVTTRKNLKDQLEKKLKTLSLEIEKFSEEQQKRYIQERLGIQNAQISEVFDKIQSYVPYLNNNFLGIPLQIYLLTELLLSKGDLEAFLNQNDEIITVVQLYEHFVEEKYKIYYSEKRNINLDISSNKEEYTNQKQSRIRNYAKVAFEFYLYQKPKNICGVFFCSSGANKNQFLEMIKTHGDPVGLISKVNENNEPEFIHNSYGEYFAAFYLYKNDRERIRYQRFIYNDKHTNIRFFLDLMSSKNKNKYYIAILYKNYKLLPECGSEERPNFTEELELSCAWNKNYPHLESESISLDYINSFNDNTGSALNYQNISKCFRNIKDSLHLCIKNLMLLLTFLIPMYNRTHHCFSKEHWPTILFYVLKFDYAFVFACKKNIEWLQRIHESVEPNILISLILKFHSFNCLDQLIKEKNYADTLLYSVTKTPVSDFKGFYNFFSRLSKATSSSQSVQLSFRNKTSEQIQDILKYMKLDDKDSRGRMPIHYACEAGDSRRIKALVSKNADLNVPDFDNKTPIHYACETGKYDIVKLLIDEDVELDVKDCQGRTPIHYTCVKGNYKIAELLISKCPNVDVTDDEVKTPLHLACEKGYQYIVELLLNSGADVNRVDGYNKKPLDYVSNTEDTYISAIRKLLSKEHNNAVNSV